MQTKRQTSIGRPVSGSKPRKHITKTKFDNPSLQFISLTQYLQLSHCFIQISSAKLIEFQIIPTQQKIRRQFKQSLTIICTKKRSTITKISTKPTAKISKPTKYKIKPNIAKIQYSINRFSGRKQYYNKTKLFKSRYNKNKTKSWLQHHKLLSLRSMIFLQLSQQFISIPSCIITYIIQMNTSKKKQIFLIFENNRIQSHHQDGSVLQIKKQKIVYISPKGIKNNLSIQQIHRSSDLSHKINAAFIQFNLYSNQNAYYHVFFQAKKAIQKIQSYKQSEQYIKMSMKVKEFRWQNPEVQEIKNGYKISSDCRLASLTLNKDLYTIQLNYLQYIRSSNTYIQKIPNMTKLLLQKYNYSYTEFPQMNIQKQNSQYYYIRNKKIVTIFNINNQWKYPLHLIWKSLITHQIITHQFCYIQYNNQQMTTITTMPLLKTINNIITNQSENKNQKQKQKQISTIPILGKINHKDKCLFMKIYQCICWFQNQKQHSFLFDSYGFWFYNNITINYRSINQIQYDQQFYPKALPLTLRFNNQPQRSISNQINLFIDYLQQNTRISQLNEIQLKFCNTSTKFDNQNNLIKEQLNQQIGQFKAYSNGTVIVRFVDRCLLTLNSKKMQVKIIKKNGQTCMVDLSNTDSLNYHENKQYIRWAVDFQERVFFIDEWIQKQEMNNQIEEVLQNISTIQKTSQTYLKMCRNNKIQNNKLIL